MSTYENMERLGMLADRIDNLIGALQLAMPPQFHVEQLRSALPEIRDGLRNVYCVETGDNPWEQA
jgi:hypothetical protein